MLTAVVDDGQQQVELFECPLLRVKLTTWIENIHQTFHLGDLSGELQLVGCWLLVSQPDQFRGCATELLIELIQAAIAAERHDRVEFPLNSQDVAAVLCGNMASHWCERGELIELTLNLPDFRGAEGPELLEGNRLQCLDHLPFGSKGRREPPEVAETVTVFWAIC